MKANFIAKVYGSSLPMVVLALAGFSFAGGSASAADTQAGAPAVGLPLQHPSGCPVPVRLPNVPIRDARPGEGAAADQQWQTRREPGMAPTAGFVESLRGNDAVVEIVLGQGRLLTLKADIVGGRGRPVIAVGDPTVVEFDVLPNPRLLRLTGRRAGITDLSITTADNQTYSFEIHVVYDLALLRAQLRQLFPDTQLRLLQMHEHLAVEGEARSIRQVDQILRTIEAYLASMQPKIATQSTQGPSGTRGSPDGNRTTPGSAGPNAPEEELPTDSSSSDAGVNRLGNGATEPALRRRVRAEVGDLTATVEESNSNLNVTAPKAQLINLLRVPGVHQVMLQVRIAELNRTGLRQIGSDLFGVHPGTGSLYGSKLGVSSATASSVLGAAGVTGSVAVASNAENLFGIFPNADFELWVTALRTNSLLTVLAEPNLVAMSGQHANFLAGGEVAIPVPQVSGGITTGITVMFKNFGVALDFLPFVMEDESIRLTVSPEVSQLNQAIGTSLAGTTVPGFDTRKTTTTVEMRQGQTLAIAGLLQVEINANTKKVPGLGDIPYLGTLFSNTTHQRVEKELLVLVTPYLVAPMDPDQVPPVPGSEIKEPTDLEFYLLNRMEGRTGRNFNTTQNADDPLHLVRLLHLEQKSVCGPVGFSSSD